MCSNGVVIFTELDRQAQTAAARHLVERTLGKKNTAQVYLLCIPLETQEEGNNCKMSVLSKTASAYERKENSTVYNSCVVTSLACERQKEKTTN